MKREMDIPEVAKLSLKGQIVIPVSVRRKLKIKPGSFFAVTAFKDMIVLKKLNTKLNVDDLKTLKLIEEAWKDIEEGRYKVFTKEEFFKELEKW